MMEAYLSSLRCVDLSFDGIAIASDDTRSPQFVVDTIRVLTRVLTEYRVDQVAQMVEFRLQLWIIESIMRDFNSWYYECPTLPWPALNAGLTDHGLAGTHITENAKGFKKIR